MRKPSGMCGYCGHIVVFEPASDATITSASETGWGTRQEAAGRCPKCFRLNIAMQIDFDDYTEPSETPWGIKASQAIWEGYVEIIPRIPKLDVFENVPEHIAESAREAESCLFYGNYRGAGALARAVIEAIAKDRKAQGNKLFDRIAKLKDAGPLSDLAVQQAHEIRILGNDLAHGDFTNAPDSRDVSDAVALLKVIINEIYQAPAKLKEMQERRDARKGNVAPLTPEKAPELEPPIE